MTFLQFCVLVLFRISLQWKMGLEAEQKIPVSQTVAQNENIEFLRTFERGVDPCVLIPTYPYYTGQRERAKSSCNAAVRGYMGLPERAQRRCLSPSVVGCTRREREGSWYCGLTAIVESRAATNIVGLVELNHCIGNLELNPPYRSQGVEVKRKLFIDQTVAHNANIGFLRAFAERGDPCAPIPTYPYHTGQRERADGDCNAALRGYMGLPERAQRRCLSPSAVGCTWRKPAGPWYCGLKASVESRAMSMSNREGLIDLTYCIGDLELDLLHRTQTVLPPNRSDRRVTVHQTEEENSLLSGLKAFAAGRDPCGALRFLPDRSTLAEADAKCVALVKGFRMLPDEAQYRCKDAKRAACKRNSYASDRYSCGAEVRVGEVLCRGGRTVVVSLSYCIGILDGFTSSASPRT